jgi:hypothetical protein
MAAKNNPSCAATSTRSSPSMNRTGTAVAEGWFVSLKNVTTSKLCSCERIGFVGANPATEYKTGQSSKTINVSHVREST